MKLGNFLFFIFFIFSVFLLVPTVSAKIYINEIDPYQGIIELYNSGDAEVNLEGWELKSDLGYNNILSLNGIIAPKEYKTFSTLKVDELEAEITLKDAGINLIDILAYTSDDYTPTEEGIFPTGHTYGRYPDGTEGIKGVEFKHPSLEKSNFNIKIFSVSQKPIDVFVNTEVIFEAKVLNNELAGYELESFLSYTDALGSKQSFLIEGSHAEDFTFTKLGIGPKGVIIPWYFSFLTSQNGNGVELKESAAQSFTIKNSPPVLINQIPLQITDEDISQPVDAGFYFNDADGDVLSFDGSPTVHLSFIKGSSVIIIPEKNWFGEVSTKIIATDGESFTESNAFIMKVNSVNDAPVAVGQEVSTIEDAPVEITLTGEDIDTSVLNYKIKNSPTKGTLSGLGQIVTYTPTLEASGVDTFTFLVNDGMYDSAPAVVTINIASIADAPVLVKDVPVQITDEDISKIIDVSSYFYDADGDTLSINSFTVPHLSFIKNGLTLIIIPEKNWFGETPVKFSVTDSKSSVESNVFTVKVNSINDAPVAVSQEVSTTEDVPVEITLGSVDIDTNAALLNYIINNPKVNAPKKGTLSGSGQIVTYTPTLEASGADTFTFLVNDGMYDSAPATVTVNIAAVADAPKFNLDSFKVEMYEDGLKVVGLNNYLTDADTPLNDLTFTYTGQEPELNLKIDEAKNELYITPVIKDWFGEKKVFLTVFDVGGVLSDTAEMTVKVNQLKDDVPTISSFYPLYDVALGEDKTQEFKMELSDPDSINPKFEWYVDGKKQSDADNTFIFDAKKYSVNEHKVKGKVIGYALEKEWKVKLVDKPVFDKFNGATTDLSKVNQAQLKSVNLVLEKLGYGKIVFDTPVDLTEILDLNNVVELSSNLVSVDKLNAPALNVPATITLYKVKFNNPVVLFYDGFTTDASLVNALCSDCQIISKGVDSITFKTKHFSSMKLGESTSLQLNVPSVVSFEGGERGATVAAQFDMANAGTSALSNLKISSTAASQYGAVFSLDGVTYSNTVTLNSLSVGMIKPIFVKATVPANIDSGWQDIGDILIVDTTLSKTISGFYLKAKDYLTINEIKVNGKTDGELVPGETNEIKVIVENVLGDGDLENIDITATLLDVNKEDLDEEESSFDLKSGASKKVSFEFELPYNLEEGSYELEIEAVGETKEGAEIEMTRTFEIDVKREGHQITISAVKSLPAKVDLCDDKTVLIESELVNIGNTAEKDLTLKLQSGGKVLGEKSGLILEKYTGKASQKAIFEVESSQLKEGKNIFTLELFNSKNNFDTKEFVLETENCVVQEKVQEKKIEVKENILPAASDIGSKSKQKITGSTVLAVRNTQEYLVLVLLGIVVLGGIILLLLGLYVFRRK